RLRAPLADQVKKLQTKYPSLLLYESRQSADLELNASLLGPAFGDADLAAFAPLAARLVRVDLTGTAVTDASATHLASLTSLRSLGLAGTQITDKTITALGGLEKLETLAVYGTGVTPDALAGLKNVKRIYSSTT